MPRHRYAVSQTSLNHVENLEGEYKEFCVSEKLSWISWDIWKKVQRGYLSNAEELKFSMEF